MNCLEYIYLQDPLRPDFDEVDPYMEAIRTDHLECFRYIHSRGYPWTNRTTAGIAYFGRFEFLRYAHENGAPMSADVTSWASYGGNLNCLRYAHENGCPWDPENNACGQASDGGHLECLRYAHEHGCLWDNGSTWSAARNGYIECLRYAHENGAPWHPSTTSIACEQGHIECIRYAHENGCPWSESVCPTASSHGHLDCLRYAHEHGCPWGVNTVEYASERGNIDCLLYALENGATADFVGYLIEFPLEHMLQFPTDYRGIADEAVPIVYHHGIVLPAKCAPVLREHIRDHARRARLVLRCAVRWIRAYNEACSRVYAPSGVGYREAESSFHALSRQGIGT